MSSNDNENMSAVQSRREVLWRNGRAIALIAAALVAERVRPATAGACGQGKGKGNVCNCFLKGTAIRTAEGWRAVEDLKVGDMVPTHFSGLQAIRWVGRYTVAGNKAAWRKPAVRICASAIAPDVPRADLVVTSAHCLLIDGLLVEAEILINGKTITAVEAPADGALEFFHVTLDRHDVIDAEGAPAETLRGMANDNPNFEAYAKVYDVEEEVFSACAPIIAFNGFRSQLGSRLRSAASPWIDRRRPLDMIRDRFEARA